MKFAIPLFVDQELEVTRPGKPFSSRADSNLALVVLQHGVDRSVIALWLGHESMDTPQFYLHANLELKERH
jgi:site-specific recombinase XerD